MFQIALINVTVQACLLLSSIQSVYLVIPGDSSPQPVQSAPASVEQSAPRSGDNNGAIDEENYIVPGATVYASSIGYHEAQRLAKENVFVGPKSYDNFIDLENGNILLNPDHNIVIGVASANIAVQALATVFIIKSGNDIVIYDLGQTKPKQVWINIDKQKLFMEPGRMLVLTQQNTEDFEKLNMNCHSVSYQNVKSVDLNSKVTKAFMADFSITSALVTLEPLRKLSLSNNSEDKSALLKLVKGTVILQQSAVQAGNL